MFQDIGDLSYFLIAFAKDEDGTIGTTSVDNVSIIIDDPTVLTAGIDGSSTTFSGVMQDGDDGNALGFTKDGSGTQTLSGENTYTGPTTVLDGTLKLGADNVLSDSTELVMDGGTLDADAATDTIGSPQPAVGQHPDTGHRVSHLRRQHRFDMERHADAGRRTGRYQPALYSEYFG